MQNLKVFFSVMIPTHRLRDSHRIAIRVIQRMRYFVAKKKFQVIFLLHIYHQKYIFVHCFEKILVQEIYCPVIICKENGLLKWS